MFRLQAKGSGVRVEGGTTERRREKKENETRGRLGEEGWRRRGREEGNGGDGERKEKRGEEGK